MQFIENTISFAGQRVKTRQDQVHQKQNNEEDTFCSEDKVIQFINTGSSNAESPTKTPKPLIMIQFKQNIKTLTADSNQAEPFTNTSEAGLFTTILKCLITTLMIEDDSESSETTAPIKQGLIFHEGLTISHHKAFVLRFLIHHSSSAHLNRRLMRQNFRLCQQTSSAL
jgi:hypothetical protein